MRRGGPESERERGRGRGTRGREGGATRESAIADKSRRGVRPITLPYLYPVAPQLPRLSAGLAHIPRSRLLDISPRYFPSSSPNPPPPAPSDARRPSSRDTASFSSTVSRFKLRSCCHHSLRKRSFEKYENRMRDPGFTTFALNATPHSRRTFFAANLQLRSKMRAILTKPRAH